MSVDCLGPVLREFGHLEGLRPNQTSGRLRGSQDTLERAVGIMICLTSQKNTCSIQYSPSISYYAWYNSLPAPYPFLSKSLNVPLLAIDGPRQHGGYLIDEECPRGHTGHSPNHPESTPLNPFTQVMRKQYQLEETVLRNHIHLFDTFSIALFSPSFLPSLLIPCGSPPDLAQLVVVIYVAQETNSKDHQAEFKSHCRASPFFLGRGAVPAEPASNARGIYQLETECRGPDQDVDR